MLVWNKSILLTTWEYIFDHNFLLGFITFYDEERSIEKREMLTLRKMDWTQTVKGWTLLKDSSAPRKRRRRCKEEDEEAEMPKELFQLTSVLICWSFNTK